MATVAAQIEDISNHQDKANILKWENLLQGDEGAPITMGGSADRSVQVQGTFGGAGLSFQGSNDGVNYHQLKDHLQNPLLFTSAGILSIDQITRFIKPVVVNGDGTTSLNVTSMVRRLAP